MLILKQWAPEIQKKTSEVSEFRKYINKTFSFDTQRSAIMRRAALHSDYLLFMRRYFRHPPAPKKIKINKKFAICTLQWLLARATSSRGLCNPPHWLHHIAHQWLVVLLQVCTVGKGGGGGFRPKNIAPAWIITVEQRPARELWSARRGGAPWFIIKL